MAPTAVDKSKPYMPLAGGADDGWSKEDEATATCFCGAVQLAFVSLAPEFAPLCSRDLPADCLPPSVFPQLHFIFSTYSNTASHPPSQPKVPA